MSDKITVKKLTLDNAIQSRLNLFALHVAARAAGIKRNKTMTSTLFNIAYGYCKQLDEQAVEQCAFKIYDFWAIVSICVELSDTPYETAYKMLALLGIEVTA